MLKPHLHVTQTFYTLYHKMFKLAIKTVKVALESLILTVPLPARDFMAISVSCVYGIARFLAITVAHMESNGKIQTKKTQTSKCIQCKETAKKENKTLKEKGPTSLLQ